MENKTELTPSAKTLEEFDVKVNEYIAKLNDLRKEGTDKIKNLNYEVKSLKLRKNTDEEVKAKIIASHQKAIEEAKVVADQNKEEVKATIKEAISYINTSFKPIYKQAKLDAKAKNAEAKAAYEEQLAQIKEAFETKLTELTTNTTDSDKLKKETKILKEERELKEYDAKKVMQEKIQKNKDEVHALYLHKDNQVGLIRSGKRSIVENILNRSENYLYQFNWGKFLMKNGLYIIIVIFMIVCIAIKPSLISSSSIWLILKNFSTRVFFALGVAGLILLAGTDLSVGRMVTLSTMLTCMILNPNTPVKFFGISFNGIYASMGFGGAVVIALLVSIAMCVLFSVIAGLFTSKFKMHPFISTLGTSLVIWGLVGFGTNNIKTGTVSDEALAIGGTKLFGVVPIVLVYAIIAIAIVWFIWNKTKFGKNMYAVGGNPEAAAVSGINVAKVTLLVFVMAGILYGLGGFFQATVTGSSSSSFGQGWELEAIAACVIGGISFTGGIGKISGAAIGCLLFEILKYYLRGVFGGSADISNIFIGIIILVAVTFDSIKYLKKK